MRLLHSCAVLAAALAPAVLADVKFLTPKAGSSIPVGTISVTWEDSGDSPSLDALAAYTITVMLGGNGEDDVVRLVMRRSRGGLDAVSEACESAWRRGWMHLDHIFFGKAALTGL